MDYETLTAFHPDSYMTKRESSHCGFDSQYHLSSSMKTESCCSSSRSPTSPVSHFIPDKPNTSLGDLFTAVLSSKLTQQSPPPPSCEPVPPPIPAARTQHYPVNTPTPLFSSPSFLEPPIFECRSRDDRELQLDMRCLRIIRKLDKFPEFQYIVRRFVNKEEVVEGEGEEIGKVRSVCGIRAYLLKVLHLKEPRRSNLNASHATLLLDGNESHNREESEPPAADACEALVEANGYNDILCDGYDEQERLPMGRSMVFGGRNSVSPETLLRRLARSISTRVSHKRTLLEQAIFRLHSVQSHSALIRRILQKTADMLPKIKSDADVCFFRLTPKPPHLASSSPFHTDYLIDVRVCKVTNAYPLPIGCRALIREAAASNLVTRFERLCYSQNVVMKLLCQLARRSYTIERKLNFMTADGESNQSNDVNSEMDAALFSLKSRQDQLEHQIKEAQRLREDLENTKFRLLTGLQYQFYVTDTSTETQPAANGDKSINEKNKKCENGNSDSSSTFVGILDCTDECNSNFAVCLAEYISKHLTERVQSLLIKLTLETEIIYDQDTVDCIGDHLRLVSSFSP